MKTGDDQLAPMGFVRFCVDRPQRCTSSPPEIVQMSADLRRELQFVNVEVNRSVAVSSNGSVTRPWRDDITRGDCKEFALAKRSRLIDLGWPASALPIAIAHVPSGELHAVLIVVSDEGDLVLDNLRYGIVPYQRLRYQWIKRMSPDHPLRWQRIMSRLRLSPELLFVTIVSPQRSPKHGARSLSRHH